MASTALELELSAIASRPAADLRAAVKHALQGGKRARGLLLMAAAEQLDIPAGLPVRAAACVELLHAATLVQDDIFDAGSVRRGRPSVVCAFGSQLAILSSDWMLAEAMRTAYGLGLGFGESLAASAQAMMTAEARECSARAMHDVATLRERATAIARGKTGALFGLALHGGHVLSGATAQAAQLYLCGLDLGVAFQYMDDALDLYGDEQAAGKDLAKDIGTGLFTMAVLDALPLLPASVAEAMLHPGSILPEVILRALRMPAVREPILDCAHTQWQQAADACGQALPVSSAVPLLLRGLCSKMLEQAVHQERVELSNLSKLSKQSAA